MRSHWSKKSLNIVSASSPVATQVPQAAGLAFAIKYKWDNKLVDPDDETQPRLALTCLGEGSTSQGEWHEGMNWAGVHDLPFICLVQNNMYAISEPTSEQMAVSDVADRAPAYGLRGVVVDGNDILASYDVLKEAVEYAYNGQGATLIEAKTYRVTPHSSDDDDRSYRSREEVEEWKHKDPICRFPRYLTERSILTQAKLDEVEARDRQSIDKAQPASEYAPYTSDEYALEKVYA